MAWSDEIKEKVWNKGKVVPGIDANKWRKDECGAWISFSNYGDRSSDYGWEIDHINPNGTDDLYNLRPLQWENNVDKSDGRLKCNVISDGNKNKKS